MRSSRTAGIAVTLALVAAVVVTGLAVVAAYQDGYDTEVGNRDDVERAMTGIFVALPWIALLAAELLAVIVLGLWRRAGQTAAGTATGAAAREN